MANRYAGQKLRASYVPSATVGQKLLASAAPAAVNAVAGQAPKASSSWS